MALRGRGIGIEAMISETEKFLGLCLCAEQDHIDLVKLFL